MAKTKVAKRSAAEIRRDAGARGPVTDDAELPVGDEPADGSIQGPVFGRENYTIFAAAFLVITVGFVTLSRGSITVAPVLLVVGYLVLVPMAILKRTRSGV